MAIPIINVSILNGNNGFRIDGEGGGFYQSGVSVSSAGDINGDGFDDVMVGSFYSYPPSTYRGLSYIVFGKDSAFDATLNLDSLNGNNGFRLSGGPSPYVVSDAGDVNGDGFDDVIIGGQGFYFDSTYTTFEGAGYVVFGKAGGFAADIKLTTLDGSNGFRLDVEGSMHVLVSGAGDINGDGFDDVIVGVRTASYVVFGKESGFDATVDLASLNGNNGFRLKGGGAAVSSAGDVNGDGFDDVIVALGATGYVVEGQGTSYVVFGKDSGFDAVIDLASLDGNNGFQLNDGRSDPPPFLVSEAGDINGDGFDDVIIGAQGFYNLNNHTSYEGAGYVLFGRASGFASDIDLSNLDGNNGFRMDAAGSQHVSVSSAGDVNGDGFDDVLVGLSETSNDFSYRSSFVVFGKASGFDAALDLSSLNGMSGFSVTGPKAYGSFGGMISSAGDVNNDGFDDLIIGDPGGNGSGASYVMFGGPFITGEPVYLGTAGDDQLTGTILAERFEAGDGNDTIDGLGGADIMESGSGDDTIAVADLDFERVDGGIGSDTLELTGEGINLNLTSFHDVIDGIETIDLQGSGDNSLALTLPSLLNLSDTTDTFTVNGDVGDRVVGLSNGWTDSGTDSGYRVFTNSGTVLRIHLAVRTDVPLPGVISLADLDGNNGFRIDGAEEFVSFGQSVSEAGDINGDGFDDVIIGAPVADSNGDSSGASYVMFGKASGFDAVMDLSSLNGSNGFHLEGTAPEDGSGDSVSSAGDVNGDGFDDVIVGAPSADPNGSSSGSSYVVFGKASGFDARMELSNLNGNNGFRVDGKEGEQSGISLSSAGDINNDGYDDVMVGTFTDSSYVVFGKASGFNATLDLTSLDGSNGFRLDGGNVFSFAYSGKSVSSAGDINGDGFDDMIVGSYRADANGRFSGASYVVFGQASGFNATLNLSKLDGSNGFRIDGAVSQDELGISVSNAGDVNGDGFDDVIVGAYYADPIGYGSAAGSSYVIFGKASGFDARLDLSNLNSNMGIRLDGIAPGDHSGETVSSAGDVNGDGFDDLMVGAPDADPNGYGSGSSYIVFGGNFTHSVTFSGTPKADNLNKGTQAAERFVAGNGNDTMIGRGGADVFHGGSGNDYIRIHDLNFRSIDGSNGKDTLGLGSNGMNLDLADVRGKISGIETIYLYGTGDNTLTLSALDLLNLSDTTNTLRVNGNAGDRVVGLDNGWEDGGIHGGFHKYTHDEAILLVGVNVVTDFV